MTDIVNADVSVKMPVNGIALAEQSKLLIAESPNTDSRQMDQGKVAIDMDLGAAADIVQKVVDSVSDVALSFSVVEELSRTVVSVRAVGSDEVIRQFPPEEFITVAKFLAAQDLDSINEDYLKGILYDVHT